MYNKEKKPKKDAEIKSRASRTDRHLLSLNKKTAFWQLMTEISW